MLIAAVAACETTPGQTQSPFSAHSPAKRDWKSQLLPLFLFLGKFAAIITVNETQAVKLLQDLRNCLSTLQLLLHHYLFHIYIQVIGHSSICRDFSSEKYISIFPYFLFMHTDLECIAWTCLISLLSSLCPPSCYQYMYQWITQFLTFKAGKFHSQWKQINFFFFYFGSSFYSLALHWKVKVTICKQLILNNFND